MVFSLALKSTPALFIYGMVLFWHAAEILGLHCFLVSFLWSVSQLVECGTSCCAPHPCPPPPSPPSPDFLCSRMSPFSLCFVCRRILEFFDLKYVKSLVFFIWPPSWLWILFLGKGGWRGGEVGVSVVDGGSSFMKKCKNLLTLLVKGIDNGLETMFSFGLTFWGMFTRSCHELWVDFFVLGT